MFWVMIVMLSEDDGWYVGLHHNTERSKVMKQQYKTFINQQSDWFTGRVQFCQKMAKITQESHPEIITEINFDFSDIDLWNRYQIDQVIMFVHTLNDQYMMEEEVLVSLVQAVLEAANVSPD